MTGDADRPPARANIALTDCIAGVYSAFGAMMALRHKERTGQGQYVDTALYECAFSFMEQHVPAYDKLQVVAERLGLDQDEALTPFQPSQSTEHRPS